ncbi:YHS domain-containing (seleno)protein [Methyloraptor flagellatus]|uniref:YHS domain-containing (Seleno)protein n=1 Tax=Methyloraptor flagellatus TaxID=3162530 RepID=A0AAU7XDA6_9HYPH
MAVPAAVVTLRPRLAMLVLAAILFGLAGTAAPSAFANAGGGHDAPAADTKKKEEEEKPPPPPPKPSYRNLPQIVPKPKVEAPAALAPGDYRFIADPFTGIALGGYDPVGYFIDGEPEQGSARFQYDWAGTTWTFGNEGNLAAFRDAPTIYAPAFGGRCPVAVAQDRATDGDPRIFAIHAGRLLMFASEANRATFQEDPDDWLRRADDAWKTLSHDLP